VKAPPNHIGEWRVFAPWLCEAKTFILKGGEKALAISRKRKEELVSQYIEWMNESRAMVVTEYVGLSMSSIDELRRKVRETGGEFHIIKNTLGKVAFDTAGFQYPEHYLDGSTAIVFAFQDAPATAKAVTEFARTSDFVKIKGGYLAKSPIGVDDVKALADLPPLPVMRSQLLGTILAPAGKLVRTLAEPGRQVAAVIKAYSEKDTAPAVA
jgi:large subunit ribosomal protein L10